MRCSWVRTSWALPLVLLLLVSSLLAQDDLDLPVHPDNYKAKPKLVPPIQPTTETPETTTTAPAPTETTTTETDDPRDETITFFGEEISLESNSIVFVIDRSGSMGEWLVLPKIESVPGRLGAIRVVPGTGISRWDLAKREIFRCINSLDVSTRFDILAFDSVNELWLPNLVEATTYNKENAIVWVESLYPRNLTNTAAAVVQAIRLDPNNSCVVLLTDGAPTTPVSPDLSISTNDWHRRMIRNGNTQNSSINVFGIRAELDMVSFCEGVAHENNGIFVNIQ